MKIPKKEKSHVVNEVDMFSASDREMTGLFVRPPLNPYEMDSYKELYPFRADCEFDIYEE